MFPLLALAASAAAATFDVPAGKFDVRIVETLERADRTDTTLTFPSPVKSPWPANDLVWVHLIVPKNAGAAKAPAVLVLPVLAAPNVWIETRFVDRFVRDGFVVMWLEMPTQFHRRPLPSEPSGQVFLARTAKHLAANFRQSVLDARRALDVLAARPEVDPRKITMFGISLGAIVGSTVYTFDPRPTFGVFLLGGADFPSLLVGSSLSGPFARKMGIKIEDLRAAWKGIDPLESKERNVGKPALLVNASWDTVIPRANARKLAEAFPDARQVWVPFGHYTAILHVAWLPRWISGHINEFQRSNQR
jgi:predicted esterase